jgi:hypothetical protein
MKMKLTSLKGLKNKSLGKELLIYKLTYQPKLVKCRQKQKLSSWSSRS